MKLLVPILHFEQGLFVCDGKLRDDGTGIENRPVLSDVVAVYVPEDAPCLKPSVQGLVVGPCNSLHHLVLRRVAVVVWALYLFRAPDVAVVGLDRLSWLEAVCKNAVKNCNVGVLTRGVGSQDPNQIPRENIHPKLVAKCRLADIFEGDEGVPLPCGSFL